MRPALEAYEVPNAASILACRVDQVPDRVRIAFVDGVETNDARTVDDTVQTVEPLLIAMQFQNGRPLVLATRVAREGLVDL
jgi:hypothetical protein